MLEKGLEPETPSGLVRSLGVLGVLFLTLSVATPVSSLFVIVPGMFSVAGTGAVWAMLLATIVCIATAYVYAELASNWPVAGGEYVMVARTLGPMAGFVMLGVNVFNNLLFPPVAGLGLSAVLAAIWPGLPQIPLALIVVGGATLVSLLQIRVNALITGAFLLIELVAALLVIGFGFGHAVRGMGGFLAAPVMLASDGAHLIPATAGSIGVAASIAIFALNGYGAAVYFGEEMHEAPRKIARAIFWAMVATVAIEGLPILAALVAAPDLVALFNHDDPFGHIVRLYGGGQAADWLAIGVAIAIVNAVIACILACARFFYGTARDRCWGRPIDQLLTAIHPRFGSPWMSTLIVGGAGAACCFVPLEQLLVLSGTGLIAIYAGIALAVIAGRRSGQTANAPFRMPLYPLAPLVTLAALGYIVWLNWLDPGEGRTGLLMTGAQILLSAAYYRLVLRPRGNWEVHVPVVTAP
ncbi:MAG: APC family permease [Sphingomonas sp.]|uniref:APC family permease n=1 Tax=Sphingomonas sp. TaxID=28214 RepID=UPI0025DF7D1A|nr:APC family permease [Sphingomonas sp.]MBY0283742.1 APC family permease [Sphingomonas sp.]